MYIKMYVITVLWAHVKSRICSKSRYLLSCIWSLSPCKVVFEVRLAHATAKCCTTASTCVLEFFVNILILNNTASIKLLVSHFVN